MSDDVRPVTAGPPRTVAQWRRVEREVAVRHHHKRYLGPQVVARERERRSVLMPGSLDCQGL